MRKIVEKWDFVFGPPKAESLGKWRRAAVKFLVLWVILGRFPYVKMRFMTLKLPKISACGGLKAAKIHYMKTLTLKNFACGAKNALINTSCEE